MHYIFVNITHISSSLLLNTLMSAFKPALISEKTMELLQIIEQCFEDEGVPLYMLFRTLGLCINICPPPFEQRKQTLGFIWKYISSFTKSGDYIICVEAWIQFVVQNFSVIINKKILIDNYII